MKRRETKKAIRRAERRLAAAVREYLAARERVDEGLTYEAGRASCSVLASLLAWHLRLEPTWGSKGRWVDGLINGLIRLPRPREISVRGEMVWGLLSDVGGAQWKEPFCAEVRLSQSGGRIRSYSLKFGDDAPLPEKLVESGSYHVLLPGSGAELSRAGGPVCDHPEPAGGYSYCFSKRGEA